MKTIGLIGGLSWESTAEYYRIINETVRQKLGGLHSAKIVMVSLNFSEIKELVQKNEQTKVLETLIDAAKRLEQAGADCLLICANTAHRFADKIQENIRIPLVHITDKTAEQILESGIQKVGLLGTKVTMEETFYRGRLLEKYNIQTVTPDEQDRLIIDQIIFKELCAGVINEDSKAMFKTIIQKLQQQGVQGIILGCTEIWMLVKPEDCLLPLFDTAKIHAVSAVDFAITAKG